MCHKKVNGRRNNIFTYIINNVMQGFIYCLDKITLLCRLELEEQIPHTSQYTHQLY